ncbi:cytochrome c biogenesis protein [Candidatus Peregrinibacteria bacterium]|jgi:cytochrome c biogenesis protein CcdA/glutaredoxin|nr:cytochrome c biogenesis protein [Candidatus Peregrinibacteria bacterium]MBT4056050.1 cytochrome c biogenesis protein [Candidatus Peregrinibacteria bacterium]
MKKIITYLVFGLFATATAMAGGGFGSSEAAADSAFANPLVSESSKMILYVGDGCPHCAEVEEHIEDHGYGDVFDLEAREIYFDRANAALYNKEAQRLGIPITNRGVPLLVVGDEYFIGSPPIKGYLDERFEAMGGGVEDPVEAGGEDVGGEVVGEEGDVLTISMVFGAALVDAINPCAFAVLIILLTTILSGGAKKKALYAGLAFSLAIFLSYLAMGFGLYTAVAGAGISSTFMKIIAVLAVILGLFNLKDYFWYGKGFKMEVPMSWRPKMKAILQSATSPIGAFLVGFLISLFLLPCTSGPYIVIIGMLGTKETFDTAAWLLVFYNLVFVAPMVFITLAIYKGFSVERAEAIRQKRIKLLHLIAGLILVIMGVVIWFDFM